MLNGTWWERALSAFLFLVPFCKQNKWLQLIEPVHNIPEEEEVDKMMEQKMKEEEERKRTKEIEERMSLEETKEQVSEPKTIEKRPVHTGCMFNHGNRIELGVKILLFPNLILCPGDEDGWETSGSPRRKTPVVFTAEESSSWRRKETPKGAEVVGLLIFQHSGRTSNVHNICFLSCF